MKYLRQAKVNELNRNAFLQVIIRNKEMEGKRNKIANKIAKKKIRASCTATVTHTEIRIHNRVRRVNCSECQVHTHLPRRSTNY